MMFSPLASCTKLYLDFSDIRSIDVNAFRRLENLQELDLSANFKLAHLVDNVFLPLQSCVSIDLSGTKISLIDQDAFKGLSWILQLMVSLLFTKTCLLIN